MSTQPGPIYALLPAVMRTRDAQQGGPLAAFCSVLESQSGIVRRNVWQLYRDQFIETCSPWAILYIATLIGFDPVYTLSLSGPDSRAEIANTMGYRRRKGTPIALEQLARDVSGRPVLVVEQFRGLITNLSLRDVRPRHRDTAQVRTLHDAAGPFSRVARTIDVRRIAPSSSASASSSASPADATPGATPMEMTLHGGGSSNVPDIALWIWRWQSFPVSLAPAFRESDRRYLCNALGAPLPLFRQPRAAAARFARLLAQPDVPEPIQRWQFARDPSAFYPASVAVYLDGALVPVERIVPANLAGPCCVAAGMVAIDPELGRIQLAADLPLPAELRASYSYGAPAAIGGGPYSRSADTSAPANAALTLVVGSSASPTLADAVAQWNALPPGSAGTILLPNFETFAADLTGADAIELSAGCDLLLAAAALSSSGAPPEWNRSCVTLRGAIEVRGAPLTVLPTGESATPGRLQLSGLRLAGELRLSGDSCSVILQDCTLVPAQEPNLIPRRELDAHSLPRSSGEPSIVGDALGAELCLKRVISGPVALPSGCSVCIEDSILDAGSPFCPACAGPDQASPGPELSIQNSTVIGRVWVRSLPLASNTIFFARLPRRDSWKAAVWVSRRQTGCVRFCWLPWGSITPRQYRCLPPDAASAGAFEPRFVSRRFGRPGYCLLAADAPMALWKGADDGFQIGAFHQIQETEAILNVQVRSSEYLPANLERGIFLVPAHAEPDPTREPAPYGVSRGRPRCAEAEDDPQQAPFGIGIGLL